jgi:hypothetical protein
MHNFKPGSGKSPSFFFFSDNKALMVKTLKDSEVKILFDQDFLVNYFLYITKNHDSLLSRILGIYEIAIGNQNPMVFLITENMIGHDFE